jgi:bifunctional DNase/RNase
MVLVPDHPLKAIRILAGRRVTRLAVDQSVGAAIAMFEQGTKKERPLTHDLLANILRALEAKIDRVIVNDLKRGTYFARLVLSAENEPQQKKIIEFDARHQRLYRNGDSDVLQLCGRAEGPWVDDRKFSSSKRHG